MKLIFCHDTYYTESPNGDVYSYGAFPYSLWEKRFLKLFNTVSVIGRRKPFNALIDDNLPISSGKNIDFQLLENINTPYRRLFKSKKNVSTIKKHVRQCDALVIRGPVELGMIAAKAAREYNKPYAVEMSGCAFDHTWYHGSPIGKIYAPIKYIRAKHMVKHASAVTYVTQNFLQKRYPSKGNINTYASNVEIPITAEETLQSRINFIDSPAQTLKIGLIGNVNNNLKGLKVAIKALYEVKKTIKDVKLYILGQGKYEKWLPLIQHYKLEDNITFCGTLSGGQEVLEWLDQINIYIQPSYHEGLPRALIEAMSRGCPALASNAGGSDELLTPHYIHKKGDSKTLAKQILMLNDKDKQKQEAQINFNKAQDYTIEKIQMRRDTFWQGFYNIAKTLKDPS